MATKTLKAVPDTKPDPKTGRPRPQSAIAFPYYELDVSGEVAKVMYKEAGGRCERAALSALLSYTSDASGSFLTRVAAARMFGFIEPDQEPRFLRVTDRGRRIAAPVLPGDAEAAKVEAFLSVPLFKRVFEEFNGSMLPDVVGLQHLFEQLGVVQTRVVPTVRIMMASAEQAGFFKAAGNKRMVRPIMSGRSDSPPLPPADPAKPDGNGGGGGGGGGDIPDVHPMILGFLKALPRSGTPLSAKRRTALFDAFKATVDVLYPEPETVGGG
jgi:hypothetical protein